jgi:murein DD-endopeptidase MepM/ murein hydrolase activator NlpD
MVYTIKSPLTKTSGHYTAQQLYAAFEPMIPVDQREAARRLIDRIVVLCKALDLDEVAVAAIVWIETGASGSGLPFRSEWWRNGYNAGNLGITGDPTQNAAAQTWSTPEAAADGLMAHVVAYAYGSGWRTVWDVDEFGQPQTHDKRFDLVLREYGGARLNSLEALNGKWAWDVDGAYDRKLAERANKLESLMDDPPVDIPTTPEEPVFPTWRQQLDVMFGPGKWSITQGWAVDSGAADYSYGAGHGLNGHQHTGLDVGLAYGTKMYAPAAATVVCGGTGVGAGAHGLSCDAFNDWGDGDGSGAKKGVGRIELLFDTGESLIYGHSRTSTVKPGDRVTRGQLIGTSGGMNGAHAHLEARRFAGGTYHLFDPKQLLESLPIGATQPEPEEPPMATKPKVLLIAGHRNTSSGASEEVARTPMMARAYRDAFRAAGYFCEWLEQDVDADSDPDDTQGGLDKVSRIAHDWIARQSGKCLLLDLHFEGTSSSIRGMFAIAPNRTGLTTSAPFPQAANDTWEHNTDDRALAAEIVKRVTAATGLSIRGGLRQTGVMDERATGVGGDGYRLATFAYTSEFVDRAIRLVVEHGNLPNAADKKIIDSPGFAAKVANAAVAAVNAVYGVDSTPTEPEEPTDPTTPPVELVPGVDIDVAQWLFGDELAPDYVLSRSGGVLSPLYKERAKAEGEWPALIKRKVWDVRVYYQFSNGWVALYNDKDKSIRWIEEVAA